MTRLSDRYRVERSGHKKRKGGGVFGFLIALFLFFNIIAVVLGINYRVDSVSMLPTFATGDRIFVTPLLTGVRVPLTSLRLPGAAEVRRGDVLLVQSPAYEPDAWYVKILDSLTQFLTFQRLRASSLFHEDWQQPYLFRRVMGVPGDTIRVEGFTVYIRRSGDTSFSVESDVIAVEYDTTIGALPPGWTPGGTELAALPAAGNGTELRLEEGQYFLLSDNRTQSFDSIAACVYTRADFVGKAIFRTGPLSRFGAL